MATANFKNYANNKMFIAIFHDGQEDQDWYDWVDLEDTFETTKHELLDENKDLITLDAGYYSGSSIGIDYKALCNINNEKERKALRIKLEKTLQKIYDKLKYLYGNMFNITWMSRGASSNNGETLYNEHENWKEEI